MRNLSLSVFLCLAAVGGIAQMKDPPEWENYEKVIGVKNGQRDYDFDVDLTNSTSRTNVLWPGETPHFNLRVSNHLNQDIRMTGIVRIIRYGTKGKAEDVWTPVLYKIADLPSLPVSVSAPAKGTCQLTIDPTIPETFGGYALVLDLGTHGRRLITSLVRTYAADSARIRFPKQSLDDLGPDFLHQVGVQAIRMGIDYTPTTLNGYYDKMKELEGKLKEYNRKNITVLLMIGAGTNLMPGGAPRSFLDSQGVQLKTKQDYAWLPSEDDDFKEFVRRLCRQYGWPRGPVTAVSLWNEPWEGISISGWQSDMLRYREIYRKMAEGVIEARQQGAEVLVGGTDSHSNAWDKLFADGSMDFLPIFDFCSIHYQGMESPALYPEWIQRKSPNGRVKIWDTESWVANTDDRIGLVVATNRSAGYDRSMGIYGGYLKTGPEEAPQAWSPAAAVGAVQHLLGEREFDRLLFPNGLPFIMLFKGNEGNKDDGVAVVCGDIGEAFGKDNILFRQVKSLSGSHPIEDGRLILPAFPDFRLFDFYGNPIKPENGRLIVPLTYRGYFLRTDGSKGSFDKLTDALQRARIEGYEPVEIIAKDMVHRIDEKPVLELQLTNILNRPVKGRLRVSLGGLRVSEPPLVSLGPHQTRTVRLRVTGGSAAENNTYSLAVTLDAGKDGISTHSEDLHVNVIAHRSIQVDGKLDDWKDVLPQTVAGKGKASVSLTEAAWYPFKNFNATADGYANAYLAYDDRYFYFAAKVADKTPHPGTYRFAHRPDDEFFYPDTSFQIDQAASWISHEDSIEVDGNNLSALQRPSGEGRVLHYQEADRANNAFAIDLSLPEDRMTNLSLYLPNADVWKVIIRIIDPSTGLVLASHTTEKLWDGAYEIFKVSGRIRMEVRSAGWWYTAKLAGYFLDDAGPRDPARTPFAAFDQEDLDTKGNWRNVYGKTGYAVFGAPYHLPVAIRPENVHIEVKDTLVWPAGVRHYTYRKDPVLPDNSGLGYAYDNVLIAFNAIPIGEDGLLANPPGTMPRYTGYKCTDYEYALNQVAPAYGGGTEIWRLLAPGMNRKHFFPRQPKSPHEGAVTDGQLVIRREGNTLITECAIPWEEIPDVKRALDQHRTVKFSFRVNDDGATGSCLELAKDRSISKRNARAFHPDWKEHWANELEFAFEK